jgi:hypothetical protein
VILVKTCQRFAADRRPAVEQTWAGAIRASGVPVYYVEGGYGWCSRDNDGHVLRVGTGDRYDDNSLKLRDGLRFLLLLHPEVEHVFVCDDDTFVHPQRWIDYLPKSEFVGLNTRKVPWVHGGAGWYFGYRACGLYIAECLQRFSGDDVLASEILSRHGIALESRPELFSQWRADRVSPDNRLITCHEVAPAEMLSLYAQCTQT